MSLIARASTASGPGDDTGQWIRVEEIQGVTVGGIPELDMSRVFRKSYNLTNFCSANLEVRHLPAGSRWAPQKSGSTLIDDVVSLL